MKTASNCKKLQNIKLMWKKILSIVNQTTIFFLYVVQCYLDDLTIF